MSKEERLGKKEFLEFVRNNICNICDNYYSWNCQLPEDKKKELLRCLTKLYNFTFDSFNRFHDMARAIENDKILCEVERRFEKLNQIFIENSINMKNILGIKKENKDES